MAIKQTIWSLDDKRELSMSSLNSEDELENLITDNINLLSSDWLVIGRQVRTLFGGFIDLLCIDIVGSPIVIEFKKDMTPREVTAQALDYASWVKTIDSDDLAQIYLKYTDGKKTLSEAYREKFNSELNNENDDSDVQIVIVATGMDGSTERIIKFLQGYNIDINVLFFNVFEYQETRFLSRAWMLDAEQSIKPQAAALRNWNGEYYFSYGVSDSRSWDDAMKYGFVSAGGGPWYTTRVLGILEPGSRIWVNIPRIGYVGVGEVAEEAAPAKETKITYNGQEIPFFDLSLNANYHKEESSEKQEYVVKVKWLKVLPQNKAVSEYGFFGNQNSTCRPKNDKWDFTIKRLKELWEL